MLDYLHCNNNQLTSLDLTNNKLLTTLRCSGNKLITGNVHITSTQLKDCEIQDQKSTIKLEKHGEYYYVPLPNIKKTTAIQNLSVGLMTERGIRLKKSEIPKKLTYEYNMFTDGDKLTKVTINIKR